MEIEVVMTHPDLDRFGLPIAQTVGSAGLDLRAMTDRTVVLHPGDQITADTGLRIWIRDPNYAGFMFARSGLGVKGLVLGNGTGVIDADYQGPLKVCLWNRGQDPITINHGDRVAQLVIMPVVSGYMLRQVDEFTDDTDRGQGGFGSTGVR